MIINRQNNKTIDIWKRKEIGNGSENRRNKENYNRLRQTKKGTETGKSKQYKNKRKEIQEQIKNTERERE